MKNFILFAMGAALSACSPTVENIAAPANTAMTNEVETVAWTGFEPGTYVVTDAKGAKVDFTINSDGTYTGVDAAGKTESGTFVMKGAKGCFTPKGAAEMCWTNSAPGADGSWIGTGDDGSKATVVKKPA
jgi:uncharacterized lipoprotein NlpE involved in copper resistance